MRPLPPRFFGPDGLHCIFTVDDDSGATAVGYLVKQVQTKRFIVSNGSTTRITKLAQTADAVSNPNNYPPATCSILLTLSDSSVEHITYLTATRCSTIEGSSIGWHTDSPTQTIGTVTTPSLDSGDDDILLESGDLWLLEDGSDWELETS
jgi:hypothetical protein